MTYRIYVKRKEELEGLKENFRKKHSEEERLKFDKNLNEIEHYLDNQEEKVTQCIDALYLSDEENIILKVRVGNWLLIFLLWEKSYQMRNGIKILMIEWLKV